MLDEWCKARRALGDCRFECRGCGWCENVIEAARKEMGWTRSD